jgi:hypothetical protein
MDLMKAYNKKATKIEEERKRKEEEEKRELESNTKFLINEIERTLKTEQFKVEEGYENPTISLVVSASFPNFNRVAFSGVESEVIDTLEKDDFGPIESIELEEVDKCSSVKTYVSVIIHLIDYSKSEKSI